MAKKNYGWWIFQNRVYTCSACGSAIPDNKFEEGHKERCPSCRATMLFFDNKEDWFGNHMLQHFEKTGRM